MIFRQLFEPISSTYTYLLGCSDTGQAVLTLSHAVPRGHKIALEAIARGRPVIASRAGGLLEAVQDGVDGVLVPPEDVSALVAALHALPSASPTGEALLRHSPPDVARAHCKAYARLLPDR